MRCSYQFVEGVLGLLGKIKKYAIVIALLSMSSAVASELESLCKKGYGVIEETVVSSDFKGCEYNTIIAFENGLGFKCSGYSYHYAYRPEVLILQNVKNNNLKY
jgi:hypothetical protein